VRGCTCWRCRRTQGLPAIAPRLTAAYFASIRVARERAILRGRLLDAERLLAHRELQLTRSESNRRARRARRDRRYMRYRQHKLERAKRAVEAVRTQMARLA
jgi:hypothetical protein